LLGIASPSKVFAQIGEYTAEGFIHGVDSMRPRAQASLGSMVHVPRAVAEIPAAESSIDRPIYADGVGLLGWLRGESELIFATNLSASQQTLNAGRQVR
jgi:hypothetical protein